MKRMAIFVTLLVFSLSVAMFFVGCGTIDDHVHVFTRKSVNDEYILSEPTCTEEGECYYSCYCGASGDKTFRFGSALGHDFSAWQIVKEPTTESEGLKERHCSRCNEKEEETLPIVIHYHVYIETVINPSCTERGYNLHKCECGDEYKDNFIAALGHSFTNYVSDNNATCTEDGTKTAKCDRCDVTDTVADVDSKTGHIYNKQVTTDRYLNSAATCTQKATYFYSCKCGEKGAEIFEFGDALGHKFGMWKVVKPATEDAEGLKERVCSLCSEKETQKIPRVEHVHAYTKTVVEPTCTATGYTIYKCRCGDSYNDEYKNSLGHNFSDWTVVKPATEEAAGLKERVCSRCGTKEAQTIPELSHVHAYTETVKEPTCTETGYTLHVCRCGESYKDKYENALGHSFTDYVSDNNETCTKDGTKTAKCDRCDETKTITNAGSKTGHTFNRRVIADEYLNTPRTCTQWATCYYSCKCGEKGTDTFEYGERPSHEFTLHEGKAATCTEDGWYEFVTCSNCDYTNYEKIAALGHDVVNYNAKPATCTEDGWEEYETCTRCEYTTYVEISALGHKPGSEWIIDKEATCTTAGSKHKECTICGASVNSTSIPALGHSLFDWIIDKEPTCTERGSKYQICLTCGNTINTDEIPALGHVLSNWIIDEEATCTTTGSKHRECTFCKVTFNTETIAKLAHTSSDWIVDADATCTKKGGKHKECTVCHVLLGTQTIPALGHKTNAEWTIDSEPGCITTGSKYQTCLVCGEKVNITSIPAIGHISSDWIVDKNATCTENGSKYKECSVCQVLLGTQTISALGHYLETKSGKVATCTEVGWATYKKCIRCDYSTYTEIPAIGHAFVHGICSYCSEANTTPTEGLRYTLNEDGKSYSCAYDDTATDTDIVIAKEYNGLPVTSINSYAFSSCDKLTSVVIPDSITLISDYAFNLCSSIKTIVIGKNVSDIGEDAFSYCSGLENIVVGAGNATYHSKNNCLIETASKKLIVGCKNSVIPSDGSVTSIGCYAFGGCTGLTSVTIPDSVTSVGYSAFSQCSGLTSVTIGDSVTSIGSSVFYGCSGLTGITIPDSVTSIGDYAFYDCSGLTSVTIGNSVTSIGDYAFSDCSGLTSITIGKSVVSIGDYAFYDCDGFENIYYAGDITSWCKIDGLNQLMLRSLNIKLHINNKLVSGNLIIPDSVTTIATAAFACCRGLTSVTIPNSVTSIGWSAFSGCSGLTSITIGKSVVFIGDYAFYDCYKLVEVINNSGLNISKRSSDYGYIGYYALNIKNGGSTDLINKDGYLFFTYNEVNYLLGYIGNQTELTIPQNYNGQDYKIYKYAFENCSGLTSVTIPDSVTSIGDFAFENCSGLTSVTIGNSVTSIGFSAFYKCSGLENIYCAGDIASWCEISGLGYLMQFGSSNKKLFINNKLVSGELLIPDSVVSIYSGTFAYYSRITRVVIQERTNSFYLNISAGAFRDCSGLTSVVIGKSTNYINMNGGAFYGCSGLTSIIVENGNTRYHSENNCLIETASKTLILGCKNSIIPSDGSVTSIGSSAFSGCSGLTSITIPDSVTSIGSSAFSGCSGLTSVTIGNSVTSIGSSVFYGCSGLESIVVGVGNATYHSKNNCLIETANKTLILGCKNSIIPADGSVISIGDRAFYNCGGLTSITIPDSVTSIGYEAFEYCYKLVEVINNSELNITNGSSDYGGIGKYALNVKNGGSSEIINKDGYLFYTYNEVNYLLGYSGAGTELTLPQNYNGQKYEIYKYAFYECDGLTSITIAAFV